MQVVQTSASISFSYFEKNFFLPSKDIGCNPKTECKAQEQEGVPQPVAAVLSMHGVPNHNNKEVTHAKYSKATSKHHAESKCDCLGNEFCHNQSHLHLPEPAACTRAFPPDSAQSRNLSVLLVIWEWREVVQAGMSNTTHKNFQITLPKLLLRQPRCFAFYCISWQQPAREVLCNKNINIIQTTLSLICPPQKRTCLSLPHAAAIREEISKVEAIAVQEQSWWNTN